MNFIKNPIKSNISFLELIKECEDNFYLKSIKKTSKFIVMEHQSEYGGLYSDISSIILKEKNKNNIQGRSLSLGNEFVHEYGTFSEHNNRLKFTAAGLLSEYTEMNNE